MQSDLIFVFDSTRAGCWHLADLKGGLEGFDRILETDKNLGKWPDIVAVMLPDIISWEIKLKIILSMRVLLVILVGCEIYGIKELEASESKKSFVDSNQESHQEERPDSFVYIYIYIYKVTKKKDLFSFFGYNFKNFKIKIIHISTILLFFRVNYFNKCGF